MCCYIRKGLMMYKTISLVLFSLMLMACSTSNRMEQSNRTPYHDQEVYELAQVGTAQTLIWISLKLVGLDMDKVLT